MKLVNPENQARLEISDEFIELYIRPSVEEILAKSIKDGYRLRQTAYGNFYLTGFKPNESTYIGLTFYFDDEVKGGKWLVSYILLNRKNLDKYKFVVDDYFVDRNLDIYFLLDEGKLKEFYESAQGLSRNGLEA